MAKGKAPDFKFYIPNNAEMVDFDELTEEEQNCLLLSSADDSRNIYRFAVIIEHDVSRNVKKKYKWESIKGVAFGVDVLTQDVDLVGGLFPRKDLKDLSSNISVQLEAIPTSKFVTAQMASQITRTIPGKNWGVYAQRTDKSARWVLKRKWIDANDFTRFEVVCTIPRTNVPIYTLCKIVGFRAAGEEVARKTGTIILPVA